MEILAVDIKHLEELAILFDQYRVFYGASSDIGSARSFLRERLDKDESKIFAVIDGDRMIGFTQLYPSFSSISMKQIWILNDLFVAEARRNEGVATLLMRQAESFAQETGAVRIALATHNSNTTAQSLYESLDYARDNDFYHYTRSL